MSYEQARAYIIDHRLHYSGNSRSRCRWTVGAKDDEAGPSDNHGANHNSGSSNDADTGSRQSRSPACQSSIASCQAKTDSLARAFTGQRAVERPAEAMSSPCPWRHLAVLVLRDGRPVRSERAPLDCSWLRDPRVVCCWVQEFDYVHCWDRPAMRQSTAQGPGLWPQASERRRGLRSDSIVSYV